MNTALRSLGLACALILPLGCGSAVSEKDPIKTTTEMTAEEKANMQKQMEESLKHYSKTMRERYRKQLEMNKKKTP